MKGFAQTAKQVGTLVASQTDAQALADIKSGVDDTSRFRKHPPKLRVALFAVATPGLLAAVTVGTLLVHNSVYPSTPNHQSPAVGGVVVPSLSPTGPVPATPAPSASPALTASVSSPPTSSSSGPPSQAPSPTQPPTRPNLFSNPSFETNTSGWQPFNSTLSRVPLAGAPNGSYVAQVTCSSGSDYDIGSVEGIGNPLDVYGKAGKKYTTSVWVRAASVSAVGKPLQLHIRERHGGDGDVNNLIDNSSPTITLSYNFQQVSVSLTDKYDGDYLDVFAMQNGSCTKADSFYADEFILTAN
jgi:hypothetical protein